MCSPHNSAFSVGACELSSPGGTSPHLPGTPRQIILAVEIRLPTAQQSASS